MKKKIIIILISIFLIGGVLVSFQILNSRNNDAKNFSKEYFNVSNDNVFIYKNVDDIIDIMKHGTGVVYLGYPECPWCQAYVKYLNEVAKEVGIDKIYYCNTKKVKENNMDKYYELVALLSGNLEYNDEGKEWIYVPNVSFHINGKVIGNDNETAKDTKNKKDPKDYWTKEETKELKTKLNKYMNEVKNSQNMCTDCNK